MKYGVCTNIGDCNKANNDILQEIDELNDFVCEECGLALSESTRGRGGGGGKISKKILGVVGGLGIVGLLVYALSNFGACSSSDGNENVCCQDSLFHQQSEVDAGLYFEAFNESICEIKICLASCSGESRPVCGVNGKKYNSACIAKCMGVTVDLNGGCFDTNVIPEEIIKTYKSVAVNKIRALSGHLQRLADKSAARADRTNAYESALASFVNTAIMEVSSLARDTSVYFDIPDYLNRVRNLPYAKVEIIWSEIAYVSDFVKVAGRNNQFEAVATVTQKFVGSSLEHGPIYQDITTKRIKLILKRTEDQINDEKIVSWEVLLGDTKVDETTPVN